jgi:dihydroxy-acid dehydratase
MSPFSQRVARRWRRRAAAWKPVDRQRVVSPALRAYAALTTNAARGAVRDVSQVEK